MSNFVGSMFFPFYPNKYFASGLLRTWFLFSRASEEHEAINLEEIDV